MLCTIWFLNQGSNLGLLHRELRVLAAGPPRESLNDFGCVLVPQLCPTLCDPMDCSPPGSSVHGILQARIPGSKPGLLHCRQILYNLSHQGSPWPPPNVTLRNHVMSLSTISWWGGRGRIYLPSPSSNWLKICPRGD